MVDRIELKSIVREVLNRIREDAPLSGQNRGGAYPYSFECPDAPASGISRREILGRLAAILAGAAAFKLQGCGSCKADLIDQKPDEFCYTEGKCDAGDLGDAAAPCGVDECDADVCSAKDTCMGHDSCGAKDTCNTSDTCGTSDDCPTDCQTDSCPTDCQTDNCQNDICPTDNCQNDTCSGMQDTCTGAADCGFGDTCATDCTTDNCPFDTCPTDCGTDSCTGAADCGFGDTCATDCANDICPMDTPTSGFMEEPKGNFGCGQLDS